jgi:hypothetical protein
MFSPVTGDDFIFSIGARSGNSRDKDTMGLDALDKIQHGLVISYGKWILRMWV